MDKITPQPIYLQFKNILLEKISEGVYPVGSCLPSERILEETYHISRVSVRKTLEILTQEGYIEKSVGKRSMIRCGMAETRRDFAFVGSGPHNALLDVYRMYYEALLTKCNLRGDNLYYINAGNPIPESIRKLQFDAVFATVNSSFMRAKIADLSGTPPAIALDMPAGSGKIRTVGTDNAAGARLAAEYLLSHGCRRILFIGVEHSYEKYQPFIKRKESFLTGMSDANAECTVLDLPNALPETIEKVLTALLKKQNRPDAVFAINDHLAITILKLLYTLCIRVPDDISVMGFDGLEIGKYLTPSLTTVAQPVNEITNTALAWADRKEFSGKDQAVLPKILDLESVRKMGIS